MQAKRRNQVHIREEDFGASVYVADRDDIFLFDSRLSNLIKKYSNRWKSVGNENLSVVTRLAEIGVLDVKAEKDTDQISQQSYSGVHLFGDFKDVPIVNFPLLVNCFCTAWCPLKCVYCHADDLMSSDIRKSENFESIESVANTASGLPALVYVITGGDPLTRPDRAIQLAETLRPDAGVVIDTSGAGKLVDAINLLKIRPMHLRVSIDSMDPRINKKTRPINPNFRSEFEFGKSESLDLAVRLIGEAGPFATGITVQTVISSKNDTLEHLFQFRDWLLSRGIKNWVLHVAINAGAVKRFSNRSPEEKKWLNLQKPGHSLTLRKAITILPDRSEVTKVIRQLIDSTTKEKLPIDIRCTDGNTAPNSVFLIGSEGDLYTQGRGPDGGRKVRLHDHGKKIEKFSSFWTYVSALDHVQRYINFVPALHGSEPKGEPF